MFRPARLLGVGTWGGLGVGTWGGLGIGVLGGLGVGTWGAVYRDLYCLALLVLLEGLTLPRCPTSITALSLTHRSTMVGCKGSH